MMVGKCKMYLLSRLISLSCFVLTDFKRILDFVLEVSTSEMDLLHVRSKIVPPVPQIYIAESAVTITYTPRFLWLRM